MDAPGNAQAACKEQTGGLRLEGESLSLREKNKVKREQTFQNLNNKQIGIEGLFISKINNTSV